MALVSEVKARTLYPGFHPGFRQKKGVGEEEEEKEEDSTGIKETRLSNNCPEDSPEDFHPHPAPNPAAREMASRVMCLFF